MNETLPFERESATLAAPDWYDFNYSRRLKPAITPMFLTGLALLAFGIFVLLSCTYVYIAAAVVAEVTQGLFITVAIIELGIVGVSVWAFARDYERRRKERRLTPYGRRFHAWIKSDFVPWLREELSIFIDANDAEELLMRKSYSHISFRGVSMVKVSYENNNIVVKREVAAVSSLDPYSETVQAIKAT
jgi:hypothetical protein